MSPLWPNPFGLTPADLAPSESRARGFDFTGFSLESIDAPEHPRFDAAYDMLWDEFGVAGEMERRDVIAARLAWPPTVAADGFAMRYAMTAALHGGRVAAVRDHTAIVDLADAGQPVVVHLSHLLVTEAFRGGGLAGWMRALPLRTVREFLTHLGLIESPPRPVVLVAEMEPADPVDAARTRRLTAYERAGFSKIDPAAVTYRQPDFRPPAAIDAARGPRPVPLSLIVRRVGRGAEGAITGKEVRRVVDALRAMYARTMRPADMAVLARDHVPEDEARVALLRPTE
jgi:hypothetical protein